MYNMTVMEETLGEDLSSILTIEFSIRYLKRHPDNLIYEKCGAMRWPQGALLHTNYSEDHFIFLL